MKTNLLRFTVTLVPIAMAALAATALYHRYVQYTWTRDGQVRANIVGIAPRVSGPIIRVLVHDNEEVKKGDLLFEIDPSDFQARVDLAIGQVRNAEANLKQQEQNLGRQTTLYNTRVTALQEFQNAEDNFAAAKAQLLSANATLTLARLDLTYTEVLSPVDGYVTNMNTSEGTYVTAGGQLFALVDINSFWIAAYFKETQLPLIQPGQKADISLIGNEKTPFQGIVRSVGWGIFVQDGSGNNTTALLPTVNQTIDWVRLPQRFAVRIQVLGRSPVPLRIGQTASVTMRPGVESAEETRHNNAPPR